MLLAVGCANLPAQDTTPPTDEKAAAVEGTVTNALTGEPLLRAHVSLRSFSTGSRRNLGALSDAAGRFSIAAVPPGSYFATAERVGFTATNDRAGRTASQIVVRAGEKKTDFNLKLTPAGAISGRVVDPDGEPVEGAGISADGPITYTPTTDDKGQFRIGGLPPGKYRVKAIPMIGMPLPPEIRTDGTVETHLMSTYYPSSHTEKGAARVMVQAGAETGGITIQLLRAPILRVSGVVMGIPKGAQRVTVDCRQGWRGCMGTRVKEDGTFEIWRIEPGKYRLTASSIENGQRMQSAPLEVEVADTNVDHLELRLAPPLDLPGQVSYDDEQARQSQQSPARNAPQRLMLRDIDAGGSSPGAVDIGPDGSFRLKRLQPGRYRASLSWQPAYVKAMRLGQVAIEGDILDLSSGAAATSLDVLVSSAVAEISGIVRDDKGPAGGVTVALLLAGGEPGRLPKLATTAEDGAYKFSGVSPGKYTLRTMQAGNLFAIQAAAPEPDDPAEVIEIHPGDKITRDLQYAE